MESHNCLGLPLCTLSESFEKMSKKIWRQKEKEGMNQEARGGGGEGGGGGGGGRKGGGERGGEGGRRHMRRNF